MNCGQVLLAADRCRAASKKRVASLCALVVVLQGLCAGLAVLLVVAIWATGNSIDSAAGSSSLEDTDSRRGRDTPVALRACCWQLVRQIAAVAAQPTAARTPLSATRRAYHVVKLDPPTGRARQKLPLPGSNGAAGGEGGEGVVAVIKGTEGKQQQHASLLSEGQDPQDSPNLGTEAAGAAVSDATFSSSSSSSREE